MGNITYSLIINSANINDKQLAEVREKMNGLFHIKSEQFDKLFSGKPIRFLKNLDLDSAQRYSDAIKGTGMPCQIEETPIEQETSAFALEPLASKPSEIKSEKIVMSKSYYCPMCKVQQENENECQHCYFNLEVYRNTMKENNFIEVIGKGYIAERRKEHRRNSVTVRREVIRMGENSDRRQNNDRRAGWGATAV